MCKSWTFFFFFAALSHCGETIKLFAYGFSFRPGILPGFGRDLTNDLFCPCGISRILRVKVSLTS